MISAASVYQCVEFKNQPVEFFIDRTIRFFFNITAPELCILFSIFYLLPSDALTVRCPWMTLMCLLCKVTTQ